LDVVDHSNYTFVLGLLAGAHGVPYLPTRTLLGSDILRSNPALTVHTEDGVKLVHVPAIQPDVAILQVQRSDAEGYAHVWGNLGVSQEAALASERVILVAEEIVAREVILSDPNRVLVPAFRVAAVVEEPFGAHPSPVQGYYGRDHAFYDAYHDETRSADGFASWLGRWVTEPADRLEYLERLGEARRESLLPRAHHYAAPVDYGY
jgi:glutaconate CoA-transferase subunit A